ncbi:MAG: tetratricopeptide repeat protein [Salibacteraceae bacterium]
MELKDVKKHIDSFTRPRTYNINHWRELKGTAYQIWENHLQGRTWHGRIEIPCKEFYLMLVDEEGRLIVNDEAQIDWVQNKHTREWLKGVVGQGRELAAQHNHQRAMLYYNLALKVDPDYVEGLFHQAVSFQAQNRFREALTGFRKALELQPENAQVYLHRANLYSAMDLDGRAMDDLNMVVRLDPQCAEAFARRGDLLRTEGNFEAAIADLRKAIQIDPNNESHYFYWARYYKSVNHQVNAFKTYRKILRLNPFNPEALYEIALMRVEIFDDRQAAEQDLMLARSLGHPQAENVLCNLFTDIRQLGIQ